MVSVAKSAGARAPHCARLVLPTDRSALRAKLPSVVERTVKPPCTRLVRLMPRFSRGEMAGGGLRVGRAVKAAPLVPVLAAAVDDDIGAGAESVIVVKELKSDPLTQIQNALML